MVREFKPNDRIRHFKGGMYTYITTAKNTETDEVYVIYKADKDGNVYAREISMFCSEVDKLKYPDITQKYRFERIKEGE